MTSDFLDNDFLNQAGAKCRTTDVDMFPNDTHGVVLARAVCRRCPLEDTCLGYALDHHEQFGVWGGMSERTRERLWKSLRPLVLATGRPPSQLLTDPLSQGYRHHPT